MQIPAPGAHQCVIGVAIALPSHYAAQVRAAREAPARPARRRAPSGSGTHRRARAPNRTATPRNSRNTTAAGATHRV